MNFSDNQKMDLEQLMLKVLTHMSLILRVEKIDFYFDGKEKDYEHVFRFTGDIKERDELQRQFVPIIMAYSNEVLGYFSGTKHPFDIVVESIDNDFKTHLAFLKSKGYNVIFSQEDKNAIAEIKVTKIINIDPLKSMGF